MKLRDIRVDATGQAHLKDGERMRWLAPDDPERWAWHGSFVAYEEQPDGSIHVEAYTPESGLYTAKACGECKGTGELFLHQTPVTCPACHGHGARYERASDPKSRHNPDCRNGIIPTATLDGPEYDDGVISGDLCPDCYPSESEGR